VCFVSVNELVSLFMLIFYCCNCKWIVAKEGINGNVWTHAIFSFRLNIDDFLIWLSERS